MFNQRHFEDQGRQLSSNSLDPPTTLQATSTGDLEKLVDSYLLPAGLFALSTFQRSAILRGIQVELADRKAARETGFRVSTQIEQLQDELADRESEVFHLKYEIDSLEEQLEEAEKNGGSPAK